MVCAGGVYAMLVRNDLPELKNMNVNQPPKIHMKRYGCGIEKQSKGSDPATNDNCPPYAFEYEHPIRMLVYNQAIPVRSVLE